MQKNPVILNNLIQVSRNLEILELVRTYATPDSRKKARSGGKFWLFFSMIRKLFAGERQIWRLALFADFSHRDSGLGTRDSQLSALGSRLAESAAT